MIERVGNKYELQCDYCSNYVDEFEDFQEAVDYKKANNWKSVNIMVNGQINVLTVRTSLCNK